MKLNNLIFSSHFFQVWRSRLVWLPESINPTDVRLVHAHPSGNLYPKRVAFLSKNSDPRKESGFYENIFSASIDGYAFIFGKLHQSAKNSQLNISHLCSYGNIRNWMYIKKHLWHMMQNSQEFWSNATLSMLFVACLKSKQNPLDQLDCISCTGEWFFWEVQKAFN